MSPEPGSTALARCWMRLDQQGLFAALIIGTLLHNAHAEIIRCLGAAVAGVFDVYGRNGFGYQTILYIRKAREWPTKEDGANSKYPARSRICFAHPERHVL